MLASLASAGLGSAAELQGLRLSGAGNSGAGLTWSSLSATNAYTVQNRDSVTQGVWVPAPGTQPWPITDTNWSDPRRASNQSRFYRVLGVTAAQRGRLLSTSVLTNMTAAQVSFVLSVAGYQIPVQYGVLARKLDYETVDPDGGRILASGVVVVPQGVTKALPLACYQHGTTIQTNQVPSSAVYGETVVGLGFAGTGYAAVLPDYLGLGDSPGYHPYVHARTEATAAIDLLRAARTWCATNGIALNGQVFLCGYSQGGHAAMALHREIETFHTNEFTITASAPMAGPYDLSGATTADFLSTRIMPNPYYFAFLLKAYQTVYQVSSSLSNLLQAPYATKVPPLLDGAHTSTQINAVMPSVPALILKPEQLAAFRTNVVGHPLRAALRDNDVFDWTPRAPTRLYHCHADQDVLALNSTNAVNRFWARGATQVQLIDPAPTVNYGHSDGAIPCLSLAKTWFDSLKQ